MLYYIPVLLMLVLYAPRRTAHNHKSKQECNTEIHYKRKRKTVFSSKLEMHYCNASPTITAIILIVF